MLKHNILYAGENNEPAFGTTRFQSSFGNSRHI